MIGYKFSPAQKLHRFTVDISTGVNKNILKRMGAFGNILHYYKDQYPHQWIVYDEIEEDERIMLFLLEFGEWIIREVGEIDLSGFNNIKVE